jgi:hypothetical protein
MTTTIPFAHDRPLHRLVRHSIRQPGADVYTTAMIAVAIRSSTAAAQKERPQRTRGMTTHNGEYGHREGTAGSSARAPSPTSHRRPTLA